MRRWSIALAAVLTMVLGACLGETGNNGPQGLPPPGVDAGKVTPPSSDPYAPCTDLATCCTPADMECYGNPDQTPVCQCYKIWDCSKNPKKCEGAAPLPPGGGSWTCVWSETSYVCTGGGSQSAPPPVGGGKWSCKWNTKESVWVCSRTEPPPNPSNNPSGTSVWKCAVDAAEKKLVCDRQDTPPPPPPPPKPGVDAGVAKPDAHKPDAHKPDVLKPDVLKPDTKPPLPKTETNCADGIDNDGDGLVDCKDPDCPPCPPPPPPVCPPGKECCDGKDNNGNGVIDEGNVCAGVGEPCPPGAYQACDCYCGVHRKCQANGTWGPCKVDGNGSCAITTTTHSSCPLGFCDYGKCQFGFIIGQCKHHTDCPAGLVCDLGNCIKDPYFPCP